MTNKIIFARSRFGQAQDSQECHGEDLLIIDLISHHSKHPVAAEVRRMIPRVHFGEAFKQEEIQFIDEILFVYYFHSNASTSRLHQHGMSGIAALRQQEVHSWYQSMLTESRRKKVAYQLRKRATHVRYRRHMLGEKDKWVNLRPYLQVCRLFVAMLVLPEEIDRLPSYDQ